MNTIRSAFAAAAVLAAGVGSVVAVTTTDSASAGTAHGGAAPERQTVFTVQTHQGTDAGIDLGKTGFSAGDQDLFTGSVDRHGSRVGHLVGSCTTARVGRSTADQLCEFVLRLGHAQITASGSVSSTAKGPGTFALPIVGGTGRYGGARGQITVTATNGNTVPITISLR